MTQKKRIPKEFLGAFKTGHRRGVREYIDDELATQLLRQADLGDLKALEALKWLTKYNNETYRGVLRKGDPAAHHKTPQLYKEAVDGHNARRRDIACVVRSGKLSHIQRELVSIEENPPAFENALNAKRENPSAFEDTLIQLLFDQPK